MFGPNRSAYALLFVIALLLRAGWGSYRISRTNGAAALEFPDEQQYWLMSRSLREGHGLRDELGFRATRMPLYPAFLSLFDSSNRGIVHARAWHWIAGALAAPLTAGLAGAFFDRRIALLSGLWVAYDPFLIFFSSLLLTETMFVSAVAALWWITALLTSQSNADPPRTGRWIVAGMAGALCIYLRESSLGLVLGLLFLLVVYDRFRVRAIAGMTLALLVIATALLPWAARNARVVGEWQLLTYRSGISLYDGVRPGADGSSDLGQIKNAPAVAGMNEVQWNRHFVDESIRAIQATPGRVARLALTKLGRMWNPLPNVAEYRSTSERLASAAWTLPMFLMAIIGVIYASTRWGAAGGRKAVFLLLPALYLSALHSLFVGSVRYRLGAVPLIATLAAVGLTAVVAKARGRSLVGEAPREA